MPSIHAQRAKKWGINPWLAEWYYNTVKYCRGEGKHTFETWIHEFKGPMMAPQCLEHCSDPPRRLRPHYNCLCKTSDPINPHKWNAVSMDLGVSDYTLQLYHEFVVFNDLCAPERTRPAPKRCRGESSVDWLGRRHAALLEGCKPPNIDWQAARAMAVSEYDRIRDLHEVQRNDVTELINDTNLQYYSSLRSPHIDNLGMTEKQVRLVIFGGIFRRKMFLFHISNWCWHHATTLFDDLQRSGLHTSSAIERAYQRDEDLMWRLFAVCVRVTELAAHLWEHVRATVTFSEFYRPYFKRYVLQYGAAHIEVNREYLETHRARTAFDGFIMEAMSTSHGSVPVSFLGTFCRLLAECPTDAIKLSKEAYDALGDWAVATEFQGIMILSPFGTALRKYALTISADKATPKVIEHIAPMGPDKLQFDPSKSKETILGPFRQASGVCRCVIDLWNGIVDGHCHRFRSFCEHVDSLGVDISNPGAENLTFLQALDQLWLQFDEYVWKEAGLLDGPNSHGRVAKEFGLSDPHASSRPSYLGNLKLGKAVPKASGAVIISASVPSTKEYAATFPVAYTSEATAQSAHSYRKETQTVATKKKQKKKTKGLIARTVVVVPEVPPQDIEDADFDNLPNILPTTFKLPRKILKVFDQLIAIYPASQDESGDVPKRGHIRWADFEKAMKRLGFEVIQTAGSSVRFDPPAKTARPISFHRPHPDSTLGPDILKQRVIFLLSY